MGWLVWRDITITPWKTSSTTASTKHKQDTSLGSCSKTRMLEADIELKTGLLQTVSITCVLMPGNFFILGDLQLIYSFKTLGHSSSLKSSQVGLSKILSGQVSVLHLGLRNYSLPGYFHITIGQQSKANFLNSRVYMLYFVDYHRHEKFL